MTNPLTEAERLTDDQLAADERIARRLWGERQEGCAQHGADLPMPTMPIRVDHLATLYAELRELRAQAPAPVPIEREAIKAAYVAGATAMAEHAGLPTDDLDEAGYDYAAAVAPGPAVEGWVLVPADPGSCMNDDSGWLLTFMRELHSGVPDGAPAAWMDFSDGQRERIKNAYAAMLAAAPDGRGEK